jgi:uncharacterized protein YkwD
MRSAATVARGLLAVLLIALFAVPVATASASARMDPTEAAILHAMNSLRAQHHLPRLYSSSALERAADSHSAHMLRSHTLSHGAFAQRLRHYTHSRAVGETLAWMSRCNAHQVVSMWLHSAEHRRIMLSGAYRRVGVGSRGTSGSCMVTADFASRH